MNAAFDTYRDIFNGLRRDRCVFTRDEIFAAWQEGVAAADLAAQNDALVAKYAASSLAGT